MSKCIICGKFTKNPSFCSDECADIYDGEAPRGGRPMFTGDSPNRKEDPSGYRSEPHDREDIPLHRY